MADSLQDQLRALGLARNEKPAQKRKKPKRGPGQGGAAERTAPGELSLDKAWKLREKEEKVRVEQARARKLAEDRKRREINSAIRKIVDPNRLNREDAEVARNFMFRGRIRKVYVTPAQNKALAAGELGLVYVTGGYHLLTPEHTEAVRGIAPDHVVELDSGNDPEEEEFPVPDDLTW
ncbi:MAG: DUF2058 family protein [Xanthomonadales bacterium]|jgi:uncharacterized protein YaiL (DUF2058 family)|nr:DUF2058 family protein [Xanthomonadales bacterium]